MSEVSASILELRTDRYPAGEITVVTLHGVEELSKPYGFELLVATQGIETAVFERDVLGQAARVVLGGEGVEARVIAGIVRRTESVGASGEVDGRRRHKVWVAPRAWLAGRGRTSRIFQDLTVQQIVDAILEPWGVPRRWMLERPPAPRGYTVQHDESDLKFVSRLLAEEGIAYAFEAQAGDATDTMALFDAAALTQPIAGEAQLTFRDSAGMNQTDAEVRAFHLRREVRPGSVLLRQFDFLRPSFDLRDAAAAAPAGDAHDERVLHVYEHDTDFDGRAIDGGPARLRLEELRARAVVGEGESRCRRLAVGRSFELAGGAIAEHDGAYNLIRIEHEGAVPEETSRSTEVYKNRFVCVPREVTCRPRRPRRRLRQTLETATVVGPAGQEIHVDGHGRIKVQFHWDLEGQRDERASCWIRVMQAWAGAGWGFQFIPRIGMEVLVLFEGGNPDRPFVVGAAYNQEHPTPFPLPASRAISGIRTQTTRGGGGYHEISFDDRKGRERLHVRSQRDYDEEVLANRTSKIGSNATSTVGANQVLLVSGNALSAVGGSRTDTVVGDETRSVEGRGSLSVKGDYKTSVGGAVEDDVADDQVTRVAKERRLLVGEDRLTEVRGCDTTVVGTPDAKRSWTLSVAGVSTLASSGLVEITSEEGIVLKCGDSILHIGTGQIGITSPQILLSADGARAVLGDDCVKVHADSKIVGKSDDKVILQSSGASLGLTGDAKLDGGSVKLKSSSSEDLSEESDDPELTTIELVDKDGNAIPHVRYRLVGDDGSAQTGLLDHEGKATVKIDQEVTVTFPDVLSPTEA